jgi:2',3'-cyclic-nucleotide 2'-phosphodiesterase (5'-nucleotidase family)
MDEMTTRFLWDSMAELAVDATTPGPRELQYWPVYKELMGRGDVPVVSSNLTHVENGEEKPVGVPYRLLERNGLKIGLIGLIGGGQFSSTKLPEGADVRWSDPIEAAKRVIPEIRDQVDLVVLMSQMSSGDTDRLLRDVEGIDVALYGNNAPWRDDCTKVGNTVTNSTGTRGQYLGHLMLIVGPDGDLVDFGAFNRQVSEDLPERPTMAEKVAEVEAQQKAIRDAARDAAHSSDLHGSSE